jgi:PDZ-binding kinase
VGVFVLERSPKPSGELRSPWAIKKVQKLRNTSKALFSERIVIEAEILKTLQHPNIIGYRGFTTRDGDPVLAMEKASRSLGDIIVERMEDNVSMICRTSDDGDVDDFLVDPFPSQSIHKVALDIGKAMEYLHKEAKLIHGDIKSANVLIFGDFEIAKLCDFGVSKKIQEDGNIEGEYAGTDMWTPMEVVLKRSGKNAFFICI